MPAKVHLPLRHAPPQQGVPISVMTLQKLSRRSHQAKPSFRKALHGAAMAVPSCVKEVKHHQLYPILSALKFLSNEGVPGARALTRLRASVDLRASPHASAKVKTASALTSIRASADLRASPHASAKGRRRQEPCTKRVLRFAARLGAQLPEVMQWVLVPFLCSGDTSD